MPRPPRPHPGPAPAPRKVSGSLGRRQVTFRLRAPNAKEVFVTGIGQRIAMEKNEQGVWTATTDTLKPDIYTYAFSADGITLNDPANPLFKTSYGSAGSSLVHVPGAVSWEPAPGVARGAVTRHFYHSAVAGDDRDYWVYTPANYDPKRKEAYPVLYLLHGLGDEAGQLARRRRGQRDSRQPDRPGQSQADDHGDSARLRQLRRPGGAMGADMIPGLRPHDRGRSHAPGGEGLQRDQRPHPARHRRPLHGRRRGHFCGPESPR